VLDRHSFGRGACNPSVRQGPSHADRRLSGDGMGNLHCAVDVLSGGNHLLNEPDATGFLGAELLRG